MINKDTPYKLAEIIRDTWIQLYILENSRFTKNSKEVKDGKRKLV